MIEIVKPHWEPVDFPTKSALYKKLELCGRTCYKSESRITPTSAAQFVSKMISSHHESVLEHGSVTFRVVCSRACSHQLVRHRIAAYSQESMRYVNYGKKGGIQVIAPVGMEAAITRDAELAYKRYLRLLKKGCPPEDARFILPHYCKTEVVCTFNIRQLRHVFQMRCSPHAQWEIRGIFTSLLVYCKTKYPELFSDIGYGG